MKIHQPSRRARCAFFSTAFAAALAAGLPAPHPAQALTFSVWDNSTGNWSDGTHWSTNPAFPNDGGGIFYDATVHGGTVAVDGSFTVTNFTLTGGTLTGNSPLTASGAVSFGGGNFGNGTDTGTTSGPLAIDLSLTGLGLLNPNYTLSNTGAGSWTGTGILYNAGTLANSGTFNIQSDQSINNNGPAGTVNNTGTITKTVATGTTTIQSIFNNTGGTVDVQSGTISLTGGGTGTGNAIFGGTGSGVLSFDSGTFSMAGGTSFAGTGLSRVKGATVNINGPVTATNFTVANGTVSGNGTLAVSGALGFGGGILGNGIDTGTTSGPLAIDLSLTGQAFLNQGYTLTNNGAGSWTGGGTLYNTGTLANSGTFNIQNDQGLLNNGLIGLVNNTGTITKTVATGTTTIQSVFNNTGGTVDVQSGTISLTGGGAATGNAIFGGTGPGVLSFDSGTFSMAAGTSFAGTGLSRVKGAIMNINGPVTATNFTVASGTVSGNGTLAVSDVLNFTGGNFGSGTDTGTTSGPLAIDLSLTGQAFLNQGYTLTNNGAGSWTGGGTLYNTGTLANSGTFNIQNDQGLLNNGLIGLVNNTGTITKTVATGTTTIQSVFNNTGGTVDVQSGTVSLNGGGAATGNAIFGGTGSGVLSFDSGTFSMTGGTSFAGTGLSRVKGAIVNINGPVTATNFTVASGTVSGDGTLAVSDVLNFTGGNFGSGTDTGTTSGPLAIDLSLTGQGFINQGYTLTNSGAGSWTGSGGTLYNTGTLANSGTFNIQNNQVILNNGLVGLVNNTGTILKTVAVGTTTIQSTFNNTGGIVDVQSGAINLTGTVTNFNGGTNTLTDGTWKSTGAGSTLSIDAGGGNRAINTLAGAADVTIGNPTAAMTGLAITSIGSGSALRSIGGAIVTSGDALTNSGTVEVGAGSTFAVKSASLDAPFNQNGGDLRLTGGTITASAFNVTAGKIEGNGHLNNGNITASGTAFLSPGLSIGQLFTNGSFSQTAGTGLFELGRSGGLTDADLLAADGSVDFSNVTVTLALAAGSEPLQLNDTFTLFKSDNDNAGGELLTLTNDTFVQDASLADYTLTPFETATTYGYTVTGVVPEPASAAMAAIGVLGLVGFRRQRRGH